MKVEMSVEDGTVKTGMLSSAPCVNFKFTVTMTETERAAVQKLGISQHRLFVYMPMNAKEREFNRTVDHPGLDGGRPCTVAYVAGDKPVTHTFAYDSLLEAQDAMQEFKDRLTDLKSLLGRADAPRSYSFEL